MFGGLQASPEAVGPDRLALLCLRGAQGLRWTACPACSSKVSSWPATKTPKVFSFFLFPLLFEKILFLQISEHFVKVLCSVLLPPLTSFCLRAYCWPEHTA